MNGSAGDRTGTTARYGVNLLRNHNDQIRLGPFDGRVSAIIELSGSPFFVTSNASYIPALPQGASDALLLRKDMRYGPDDPTLWPQQYSSDFCHLGAIPRKPSTEREREALGVMWWDPDPKDFECPESGQTLTHGLGKLSYAQCQRLAQAVDALLEEYTAYVNTVPPSTVPPLMPQLSLFLRLGLERLQSLPSTYVRAVINVTNVQRSYLELKGMISYMTVYKPRIEDPSTEPGLPDDCVAFRYENILSVVTPLDPAGMIELEAAHGFPPVPVGTDMEKRMRSLHLCTQSVPWYKNPFSAIPAPSFDPNHQRATSKIDEPPVPAFREPSKRKNERSTPYAQPRNRAARSHGIPKTERDKFILFDSPDMPPGIASWERALSQVDRSLPSQCGPHQQNRYVFPEPALLLSAADDGRRRVIIHHYQLMRDALMYHLGDASDHPYPLKSQEWRDILHGKITRQGKPGTRAEARSASIETVLGSAMRVCGIDKFRDFPVDPCDAPRTTHNRTMELVWETAEINFRFELLALDARASGLDRSDECRLCFPGTALLVGFDIGESKMGFASLSSKERLPYVLHLAGLMLDWQPRPRPTEITSYFERQQPEHSTEEIDKLEHAVAGYYTQCFYELFGRAAVVPMRLRHEFGT
ncbi:hypothetical protein B0H13DRAFT_2682014 [Mycena leptocephala]|nr:hypothetical protein B0H13DRAFT_2682014 [Mycena leptocephala]